MRKPFILVCLLLVISLLVACAGQDSPKDENENRNATKSPVAEQAEIKDYFPIRENVRYVYEGSGNEYASYDVHIDYTSDDRVQRRVNNGGTVMAEVIALKDGKLTKLLAKEEAYYRENLLQTTPDTEGEVLLMEPLKKGTNWQLKDGRVREITNIDLDITTPAGNYKAIEVVTEGANGKTTDYYAKDVGLVKSVFVSGETEVTSTLSKIEENVSLVQTISFFYPSLKDGTLYYKDRPISFKTNDVTRELLASAYKEPVGNDLEKVFSKNTKINSLYLNKDGMVYIDLNREFITEMNAGALYESLILQSIANTFGKYYGAEKVVLTIDNKPYQSGHIALNKGEFLPVNYENSVKITN